MNPNRILSMNSRTIPCFLATGAILVYSSAALAGFITFSKSEFHVDANAGWSPQDFMSYTLPVSAYDYNPDIHIIAYSSIEQNFQNAFWDGPPYYYTFAHADSHREFTATFDKFYARITPHAYGEFGIGTSLYDMTSGSYVFYKYGQTGDDIEALAIDGIYDLISGHSYELWLGAGAGANPSYYYGTLGESRAWFDNIQLSGFQSNAGPDIVPVPATVIPWGNNGDGRCIVPLPNEDFIAVDATASHSVGLKVNGSVVAWGYNGNGQCNVPSPNSDFTSVRAGVDHSLGLKCDSSIVAWGSNDKGQLNVPSPNSGFVAIGAGGLHSVAIRNNGSIVAWGNNQYGQLNITSPNEGFVAIDAGGWHTLALKADGSIVAWGRTSEGQCSVPSPNGGFVAVAAGGYHSLALRFDGSIVAWGENADGQCNLPSPNLGFVAIAAGGHHSLALKADGSIVVWGWNEFGQCNIPVPNTRFVAVAAGGSHSVCLRLPNSVPVADAGPDVSIQTNQQAATTICGTVSDPDGDALKYRWLEGDEILMNWALAGSNGQAWLNLDTVPRLARGNHTLTLQVLEDGELVRIPSGTFTMGDPFGEGWQNVERPVHSVGLDSFWIGRYKITNGQFCEFLNAVYPTGIQVVNDIVYQAGSSAIFPYCMVNLTTPDPSLIVFSDNRFSVRSKGGRDMSNDPMVEISWYGAAAYCNWRSERENRDSCYDLAAWSCDFVKNGYRLPTEAEWEYAARGGLVGKRFPWGDMISQTQANYGSDPTQANVNYFYDLSDGAGIHPVWGAGLIYPCTSPVGSFASNGFGLYDMAGNVYDWCNDCYDEGYYSVSPSENPKGPDASPFGWRALRGGAWSWHAAGCRVSGRNGNSPFFIDGSGLSGYGFRIARAFNPLDDIVIEPVETMILTILNTPPVANAGPDRNLKASEQASTTLNGVGTDDDLDALEFRWTEGSQELSPWSPVGPDGQADLDLGSLPPFSIGGHTLTLWIREANTQNDPVSDGMTLTITEVGVSTAKDSFLRISNKNTNEGANPALHLRGDGNLRMVMSFDMAAIPLDKIASAKLILTIRDNFGNWATGKTIDAHPLLVSFDEGNGKELELPPAQRFSGAGSGVTWNCSADANIANQSADCATLWNGGTFGAKTAPSITITNDSGGKIQFDVTADVLAGNNLWLIRKTLEGAPGGISFFSREGSLEMVGDLTLAPRLVITARDTD